MPKPQQAPLTVLTYNVCFNKGLSALPLILQEHQPDIICLQEVDLGKPTVFESYLPGYVLGATSDSFYHVRHVYGLATLYKQKSVCQIGSNIITLPRSFYETVVGYITRKGPRSVLHSSFVLNKNSKRQIHVYNVHLTHIVASNTVRQKQLQEVFDQFHNTNRMPTLVLGDFNYAIMRRGLERIITQNNFREATSNLTYTEQRMMFLNRKFKLDYILHSPHLTCIGTWRLDSFREYSDHYPVLSAFSFE